MTYMLDTNICIYIIKNQPEKVARRFAQCQYGEVVMSSITYAELWHGVSASGEREAENRQALTALVEDIPVLPFAEQQAEQYGMYRAMTNNRRAVLDYLIAAHAKSESCILVTNNEKDFKMLPDLEIQNWA